MKKQINLAFKDVNENSTYANQLVTGDRDGLLRTIPGLRADTLDWRFFLEAVALESESDRVFIFNAPKNELLAYFKSVAVFPKVQLNSTGEVVSYSSRMRRFEKIDR